MGQGTAREGAEREMAMCMQKQREIDRDGEIETETRGREGGRREEAGAVQIVC